MGRGCAAKAYLGPRRKNLEINGGRPRPPIADGNAARVLRSNMMEWASRGDDATRNIVAIALEGLGESVIRSIGHIESSRRRVREKKHGIATSGPRVASELNIPDSYTVMDDGRQFPHHDSGPESADAPTGRAIVFAAEMILGVLAISEQVFADDNFSMSPGNFSRHTFPAHLSGKVRRLRRTPSSVERLEILTIAFRTR